MEIKTHSSGSLIATFLASPFYVASTCIMIQYLPIDYSPPNTRSTLKRRLSNCSDGYLMPNQSASTIPPYQLVPKTRSLYGMMRDLICLDTEGLGSLWKAFPSLYLYTISDSILHSYLESLLLYNQDEYTLDYKSLLMISGIKGWVLSILQVVSTRMIAQTMHPKHKTYSSTLACFSDVSLTTYFSRPCILGCLEASLECVFEMSSVFVYMRFGSIGRIIVQTASLLTLLPIKVIRRRMELPSHSFPTVVQTSKVPYPGIIESIWRITRQEGISVLYSTFWYRFWIMLTVEGLKSLTLLLERNSLE